MNIIMHKNYNSYEHCVAPVHKTAVRCNSRYAAGWGEPRSARTALNNWFDAAHRLGVVGTIGRRRGRRVYTILWNKNEPTSAAAATVSGLRCKWQSCCIHLCTCTHQTTSVRCVAPANRITELQRCDDYIGIIMIIIINRARYNIIRDNCARARARVCAEGLVLIAPPLHD